MTPFCTRDPNEATRGFRFWEAGYWKGALGERPYHISALFVVDLARFRSQAAMHRRVVGSRMEGRKEQGCIGARDTQPSVFDLPPGGGRHLPLDVPRAHGRPELALQPRPGPAQLPAARGVTTTRVGRADDA